MGYAYPVDSILTYIAGEPQYDRAVSSETLRSLYAAMMTNGILLRDSTNLQVVENEGFKLKVKSGFCLMNGCMKKFDNDINIELAAAEATRVDTIVARLNLNQEVRDITIQVIQGTGTEPPALVREGDIYDLGLANVTVNVGAVTIAQADINDTRLDTERCGIISSISEFDTKTLYDQMNDSFYTWFESIKGQLGDDVAGGLQMQVNDLQDEVDTLEINMEDIINRLITLENGCTLPPRPVTVDAAIIENLTLEVHWNTPPIYDVQLGAYNIYGYVGDTEPTDFSQYTLITSVDNTKTSNSISVSNEYDYVLVTSVSTDGAIQKDLSQSIKTTLLYDTYTLADYSWGDIDVIGKYRSAGSYFSIGDTKSVVINGTPYDVQLYNFSRDTKTDGTGKAKMTFGLVNCYGTARAMHSSANNSVGWKNSTMRTYLNGTMFSYLPLELRNVIKEVNKTSVLGSNSSNTEVTSDKLFLFSEREITGDNSYSYTDGTSQYTPFATSSNRIKKLGDSGSATNWWTRSASANDNSNYVSVRTSGSLTGTASATQTYGICFGFCI